VAVRARERLRQPRPSRQRGDVQLARVACATVLARPDVLVLAAGGILGEAWMSGVLAGIEDQAGWDFRASEAFVGTSAGSIVAARLAAGRRPRRPEAGEPPSDFARAAGGDVSEGPEGAGRSGRLGRGARRGVRLGLWASTPFVPPLLALGAAPGARLRALALARLPDRGHSLGRLRDEVASLGSRFDGRLRVVAVDRASGRRVAFGRPGEPRASVADAVIASCSIPWVFRPVRIGERQYVDGGVWSLTNLDTAPAGRETEVLCLHPSASTGLALSSPTGALRAAAWAGAEVEALALRARGTSVRILGPDEESAAHMGAQFMDPRPAKAVHAAGYAQGRALGAR
jgi:NTE family protein